MRSFRIVMTARYLPPEYSGAASQAFLLADRLRARGHHVEFVTQSWRGDGEEREYEVDGFRVTALRTNLSAKHTELSLWRSLLRYLWRHRHRIDILHSHGAYYTQAIVGPLGRLLGKPSLVKVSLADNDLCGLGSRGVGQLHRYFLEQVSAYVAISADLEAELRERGLRKERIHAIPNGVDMERYRPADPAEKHALAEAMGLPSDRPFALFVGVFDERKRISWLMENWIASAGFGTGARLLAVGPTSRDDYGPALKKRMEGLAAAHPDLAVVRDFSPEIECYYRLADLFVFPTANEGMPNALLEAMSCALPCIATRVSGSTDLIEDGATGILFDVDDADSLASALGQAQGEGAAAMGRAARRFVRERYDIEQVAASYEGLYGQLMARRGARAADGLGPGPGGSR